MKKVLIDGETCYSVSDAAKYLGIRKAEVMKLISGEKIVMARQRRANSRNFYVTADSLVDYKYK